MRRIIQTAALCLALATPAHADIVYQGRDAQGLQCAAMVLVVAGNLSAEGMMDTKKTEEAVYVASVIMGQLPGTKTQVTQAVHQRATEIAASRTSQQVLEEFNKIHRWCANEFLR